MFRFGVEDVRVPAGLSHSAGGMERQAEALNVRRGGLKGPEKAGQRGRGAGVSALCPQPLRMSLGSVFS